MEIIAELQRETKGERKKFECEVSGLEMRFACEKQKSGHVGGHQ